MNTPTAGNSVPGPFWLRFLRSVVLVALALTLTFIMALLVLGCLPLLRESFASDASSASKLLKTAAVLATVFLIFLPVGLALVVERKRWLTWRVLTIGWIAVLPVLGWLAWDEPTLRHPLPIEELSPAFPGADQSYAVLMQYSKDTPSQEARDFGKVKLTAPLTGASSREPAKWREYVTQNRPALEADWAALAPQRRWLDELSSFERLGDLTPASLTANLMSFQVWRTLSQRTCAFATLQAIDGHGDEAIATLLPMLKAGIRLQPSSRTLVRSMVAIVVERMCLETAGIVLDLTPVSAAARAQLLAALGLDNAAAIARHLILTEYAQIAPYFSNLKLGNGATNQGERYASLRSPLNFLGSLLVNPVATTNLYGDRIFELAALAEKRELGKFAVQTQGFEETLRLKPGMKNLAGRMMLTMAVPAYKKVIESYWTTVDLQTGLRKRLAIPAPA